MMCGLRTAVIFGALLTSILQAHAQAAPDREEWVCSVRDPEAPDPGYFFDVTLRVNNKDFRASLEIPHKNEAGQENTTLNYMLIVNDALGINAFTQVPNGPPDWRFGIRLLLLNKKDGGFRAGAMVTDVANTHFVGSCKRK